MSKIINNLQEFLDWRGFSINDGAYRWARCFYKYTDCGPWVTFMMTHGREAYYEDKAVNDVTNDNCTGLKIGSIVEGSDVEWGPEEFIFPFESEDFDKAVENMEAETSFYWERDNSQWYKVQTPRGEYYLHNTWGEIVWDGQKPAKALREKIEEFIHEHFDEIVHEVRTWHLEGKPDWKPTPIPGTRSTIHEYCNDYTF